MNEPESAETSVDWWDHAVGYEAYIRSFADGNDDGVGDFIGMLDKLDHLAWLGIDILWITPFYTSPMSDWGYDVADYTAVDPTYGTLDDFDAVVAKAHDLGIRVLIDIVPNHSSDQHRWFQEALADPTSPYRDYYIWVDPPEDGSLPNNWVGYFGGKTWTLEDRELPEGNEAERSNHADDRESRPEVSRTMPNQYYLHLFLPSQPDLNWRNPAVLDEFDNILRFWLDRGVDGFRIDVAQALVKDAELRSNPQIGPSDDSMFRWEQWDAFDHQHDILQPESVDIFKRWNAIASEYDALLLGETYDLHMLDKLDRLVSGGHAIDVGFWFGAMHMEWDAQQIRSTFELPLNAISAGLGWAQNSHDEHRSVTRFGGGDLGRRRALSLSVLLLGLPGLPFLYQGEELGLESGTLPADAKLDPIGGDDPKAGRDGTRTPMPWSDADGMGFTSAGVVPWLPFGGRTAADTAEVQRTDPTSSLHAHRELLAVRKTLGEIANSPLEWIETDVASLVAFRRGDVAFVANVSSDAVVFPVAGTVLYRSGTGQALELAGDEAMIIRMES